MNVTFIFLEFLNKINNCFFKIIFALPVIACFEIEDTKRVVQAFNPFDGWILRSNDFCFFIIIPRGIEAVYYIIGIAEV